MSSNNIKNILFLDIYTKIVKHKNPYLYMHIFSAPSGLIYLEIITKHQPKQ